jgi:3-hydroxymyristoyl/3-hydroxydecanoyl-(acyl carrier protein) dehydratase
MFCFVDQIVAINARGARGRFAVPEHFGNAPSWLVPESLGQLAAWIVMDRCDFRSRPVAALVGSLTLSGREPLTGEIDLSIEIERTDRRAVLYGGTARRGGSVIGELRHCLGPLLPMEQFDDPDRPRALYERLRSGAPQELWAPADALPALRIEPGAMGADGERSSTVVVPAGAAFLADHFPRLPVLPATMLIQAMSDLAVEVAAERLGCEVAIAELRDVKVRSFTAPGETLTIEAQPEPDFDGTHVLRAAAKRAGKKVATVRVLVRGSRAN